MTGMYSVTLYNEQCGDMESSTVAPDLPTAVAAAMAHTGASHDFTVAVNTDEDGTHIQVENGDMTLVVINPFVLEEAEADPAVVAACASVAADNGDLISALFFDGIKAIPMPEQQDGSITEAVKKADKEELFCGFTRDQLIAAFNVVKNKENWKDPIDTIVDLGVPAINGNTDLIDAAIAYFTGGGTCIQLLEGNRAHVTAPGYYVLIGA